MNSGKRLKLYAAGLGIRQWQLADKLGWNESTLSKKLRHELSADDEQQIRDAITSLIKEDDE